MKNTCAHCDYEMEWPDSFVAGMHPPKGAVEIVSLEGCPKCGDGNGCAFKWKMEDGTYKSALAGVDELEGKGVTILDFERSKKAARELKR